MRIEKKRTNTHSPLHAAVLVWWCSCPLPALRLRTERSITWLLIVQFLVRSEQRADTVSHRSLLHPVLADSPGSRRGGSGCQQDAEKLGQLPIRASGWILTLLSGFFHCLEQLCDASWQQTDSRSMESTSKCTPGTQEKWKKLWPHFSFKKSQSSAVMHKIAWTEKSGTVY